MTWGKHRGTALDIQRVLAGYAVVMALLITARYVLPGETWHFHWAKSGEYVTQVSAIGPLGLEYHDDHDDPRLHAVAQQGDGHPG